MILIDASVAAKKMAKSPTRRSRRVNTPFSKAQEIWIVQRSALLSLTQLRRQFIKTFLSYPHHREAPNALAFEHLVKHFQEIGGVTGQSKEPDETVVTPQNIARLKDFLLKNPKSHTGSCLRIGFEPYVGVEDTCDYV